MNLKDEITRIEQEMANMVNKAMNRSNMNEDYEENIFEDDDLTPDEDGLLNRGEMTLAEFDDANVPVDIWLEELNKDNADDDLAIYNAGYRYSLRCGNYMPRKGSVSEGAVNAFGKDKETMQKAINKYILPLYQTAISKITKMAETGNGDLYYWSND